MPTSRSISDSQCQVSNWQFVCLPFSISTAPKTFTKVLPPLIALLRKKGLHVSHYLDNLILLTHSRQTLMLQQELLQKFGWVINFQKPKLIPSQQMLYLGALFNTVNNSISLPQEKIVPFQSKLWDTFQRRTVSPRTCLSFIYSLSATIPMVRWVFVIGIGKTSTNKFFFPSQSRGRSCGG